MIQARVDDKRLAGITRGPLPGSRKVYLPGTRFPGIRVPAREIALTPPHAPVTVDGQQ